ncbi:MAG: hypothetical protein FJ270_03550 [Planctomycetes bacterium]|nr:hypothetical protein [Planctomycetota bacterium]
MQQSTRSMVRGAMLAVAILACIGGCQRVLFNPDEPYNQYDRYDRLRDGFSPTELPDEYGVPQPALRARLSPNS